MTTACRDCVGLFWKGLYINPGSFPGGREARCEKAENEIIKEEEFNPVTGETDKFEYYPGGDRHPFLEKGDKYKLCSEVNQGDCKLFEKLDEERNLK